MTMGKNICIETLIPSISIGVMSVRYVCMGVVGRGGLRDYQHLFRIWHCREIR